MEPTALDTKNETILVVAAEKDGEIEAVDDSVTGFAEKNAFSFSCWPI